MDTVNEILMGIVLLLSLLVAAIQEFAGDGLKGPFKLLKKKTLAIALVVAVILNVDVFHISHQLSMVSKPDQTIIAVDSVPANSGNADITEGIHKPLNILGWNENSLKWVPGWIIRFSGFLISALAIGFFALIWSALLNKLRCNHNCDENAKDTEERGIEPKPQQAGPRANETPSSPLLDNESAFLDAQEIPIIPEPSTPQGIQPGEIQVNRLNYIHKKYEIPEKWWLANKLTGKGVTIAIVGTGISPHPDIASSIIDWYSVFNIPEMNDIYGLGTQAAAIIGGKGKKHVFGVAPEANLLGVQVGKIDRDITIASIIEGLKWVQNQKADIVAILTDLREVTDEEKQELTNMIQYLNGKGIVVMAPVGNTYDKKPVFRYPASLDGVISIGSTDHEGKRSLFSAKSSRLDVTVPGEGLITINYDGSITKNMPNTAIATAFAAGIAALVIQYYKSEGKPITPDGLRSVLRTSSVPRQHVPLGNDVELGFGALDTDLLLQNILSA